MLTASAPTQAPAPSRTTLATWRDAPLAQRVSRDREFSAPLYQSGRIAPLAATTLSSAATEARSVFWPAGSDRDAAAGVALLRHAQGPFFATALVERSSFGDAHPATMHAGDRTFEWWTGAAPGGDPDVRALISRTELVATART